jgi:hypothetical protein
MGVADDHATHDAYDQTTNRHHEPGMSRQRRLREETAFLSVVSQMQKTRSRGVAGDHAGAEQENGQPTERLDVGRDEVDSGDPHKEAK